MSWLILTVNLIKVELPKKGISVVGFPRSDWPVSVSMGIVLLVN